MQIPSITNDGLRTILSSITSKENLRLTPQAIEYLIHISSGYVRPMIQWLEKLVIYKNSDDDYEYTKEMVVRICSTLSDDSFEEYFGHLSNGDMKSAVNLMYEIIERGYSVIDILEYLYDYVKRTVSQADDSKYVCIREISELKKTIKESMEDKIEMLILSSGMISILDN
jgi:DNA polymerase III gamma/tau subunit